MTHVTASCSESGIWQPIDFECVFDPLAVNLKEKAANFGKKTYKDCSSIANDNGSSLSDFAFTGGQGTGTLVTLSVLGTLVFIVILFIVVFFTQRKCFTPEDSNSTPKISRSSTNQLIADVANGLVAHIDGPEPNKETEGSAGNVYLNHYDDLNAGAELGTFRPSPHTTGQRRSAGDGGSVVDENNYSSLKNLHDPELDIEESHYAMVRQPDGRADEPTYSSLKYGFFFSNSMQ